MCNKEKTLELHYLTLIVYLCPSQRPGEEERGGGEVVGRGRP